jgi:hypothetical protein
VAVSETLQGHKYNEKVMKNRIEVNWPAGEELSQTFQMQNACTNQTEII